MVILFAIHVIVALFLIGIILLQKSEGGLGGLGGGSGGLGGMMSGRAKANVLTKTTTILAAGFFITSLLLALLSTHGGEGGILVPEANPIESGAPTPIPSEAPTPEGTAPQETVPTTPAIPAGQ